MENNIQNRVKLAEEVVESWDMDDLIDYAPFCLGNAYMQDDELFQRDWKTMMEPE